MNALNVRVWVAENGDADPSTTERRELLLQQLREVRCFSSVKAFLKNYDQDARSACCTKGTGIGPSEKLTLLLLASVSDPPLPSPLDEEIRLLRCQLKAICDYELGQSVTDAISPPS